VRKVRDVLLMFYHGALKTRAEAFVQSLLEDRGKNCECASCRKTLATLHKLQSEAAVKVDTSFSELLKQAVERRRKQHNAMEDGKHQQPVASQHLLRKDACSRQQELHAAMSAEFEAGSRIPSEQERKLHSAATVVLLALTACCSLPPGTSYSCQNCSSFLTSTSLLFWRTMTASAVATTQ
jgi:hypothetical protein